MQPQQQQQQPQNAMGYESDSQLVPQIAAIESSLLNFHISRVDNLYHDYNTYVGQVEMALNAHSISPSTKSLAENLSLKVFHAVESSLELANFSKKLMGSFLDETKAILESDRTLNSTSPSRSPESMPAYIKPSHQWLLTNIHNPYPSAEIRTAIARKSGATRKDVDNWFRDARKRIGWIDARKAHFSNKRVDMVDAATRFYANDEKLSLSQDAEHALVSVMKNAKDLYRDKFHETTLAATLDVAVKDLTLQSKVDAGAHRKRQLQTKESKNPYPSPDRSPELLPSCLSPALCDGDGISICPTSDLKRKRRSSCTEPDEIHLGEAIQPVKRLRSAEPLLSPRNAPSVALPSPASSVDDSLANLPSSSLSAELTRKRRSSVSGGSPRIVKRPCIQNVSDPVPVPSTLLDAQPSSFEDWFEHHFNSPAISDGDLLGFDFELGILPDAGCGLDGQSLSAQNDGLLSQENVDDAEPVTASHFNLEELSTLWSNTSHSITSDTTCVPLVSSVNFDSLDTFNPLNTSSTFINPLASPSPVLDFSWGFLDVAPQGRDFDGTDVNLPLFPETHPNLFNATFPTSSSRAHDYDCIPGSDQTVSRAEKMQRLQKMKEDTLRLELELATSGI
ncbi:hypothetical protein H0H93_014386 [Arthromyces matolae]|nr:hypothetical protein H0H93_014386 [Arthromyces matolae]